MGLEQYTPVTKKVAPPTKEQAKKWSKLVEGKPVTKKKTTSKKKK